MTDFQPDASPSRFRLISMVVYEKDWSAHVELQLQRNPVAVEPDLVSASPATAAGASHWTEQELAALYNLCKPVQRAILTRLAQAGAQLQAVSYADLFVMGAAETNNPAFNETNLWPTLAWITKFVKKIKGSIQWPLWRDPVPGAQEYQMDKPIADLWLALIDKY